MTSWNTTQLKKTRHDKLQHITKQNTEFIQLYFFRVTCCALVWTMFSLDWNYWKLQTEFFSTHNLKIFLIVSRVFVQAEKEISPKRKDQGGKSPNPGVSDVCYMTVCVNTLSEDFHCLQYLQSMEQRNVLCNDNLRNVLTASRRAFSLICKCSTRLSTSILSSVFLLSFLRWDCGDVPIDVSIPDEKITLLLSNNLFWWVIFFSDCFLPCPLSLLSPSCYARMYGLNLCDVISHVATICVATVSLGE